VEVNSCGDVFNLFLVRHLAYYKTQHKIQIIAFNIIHPQLIKRLTGTGCVPE
jgi:hypothetical protein